MYDKKVICDKYLNRGVPLVRLDEKFIFFTQIINDLENVKPHHDIKAIRINLRPLIQSIIEHAVEWRNTLGNMVSDRTNIEMIRMNVEFKVKTWSPLMGGFCICQRLKLNFDFLSSSNIDSIWIETFANFLTSKL
jgi:hypothetical protein